MKKYAFGGLVLAAIAGSAFAMTSNSGLSVGETVTPFHPRHVAGPDKGTDACPPCTYGNTPAVQAWINTDKGDNFLAIAKTLNDAAASSNGKFKGFLIVLTDKANSKGVAEKLTAMAEKNGLKDIGVAYLDRNDSAIKNYKVNTAADVKNTIIVYKNRKVTDKFVNLEANADGLKALKGAINKITS